MLSQTIHIMPGPVGHQLRLSAFRHRPRILVSPPAIRLQTPGQRRHFGFSDAAGHLLSCSESLFTNVHQLTASPWYISIPLVAIITSTAVRLPLTLWMLNKARKRSRLTPLIQAQTAIAARGLRKQRAPNILDAVSKVSQQSSKRLLALFGQGGSEMKSFAAALLSLPLFLSNVEVLRRMSGGKSGIFGLLLSDSQPADDTILTAPTSSVASTATLTDSDGILASASTSIQNTIPLEPALADGGCMWFPNLLEADPYHVLPFAVSAVMLLHVLPGTVAGVRQLVGLSPANGQTAISTMSKLGLGFQRGMLLFSLLIGPLTANMPAAIHLYWFSSTSTSLLITKGLRSLRPIPRNLITPCKGAEMPLLRPKAPPPPQKNLSRR